MVKILLSADASASVINSKDEEGWTPIHSAASIGNLEIVEALLSKGQCYVLYLTSEIWMLFLMSSSMF